MSRSLHASRSPLLSVAGIASLALLVFGTRRANRQFVAEQHRREIRKGTEDRPASAWWPVFREVRDAITKRRIVAVAAGVTFYSLLAVFPAIAALVSLYALFANPAMINQQLAVAGFLPGGAIDVIRDEISRIASQRAATLGATFLIALLVSLWSANGGIKAMFDALNVVYGVTEKRGFLKLNATSLAFVVGGTLFFLVAIAAVIAFPVLGNFFEVQGRTRWIAILLGWPLILVLVAVFLALLYRYGPSRPTPKWHWIKWGGAFGAVGWVVASVAFSWYAANFGTFNKTYGSLGAVIGFMIWIWVSAIVVLIGAEINAAVERRERLTPL